MSMFEGTGVIHQNKGLPISISDYGDGFTLWVFDFTGEGKSGQDDGVQHIKEEGEIIFDVKFGTALPHNVTLVVLAEYENKLKIDKTDKVTKDY